MERRIEIKRQDAESLNPYELVERLSRVFGLKKFNSVEYQEGVNPELGTLILRGEEGYDIQQTGYIISSAGYTVITNKSKPKPAGNTLEKITSTLGVLKGRVKQLGENTIKRLREKKDWYNLLKGDRK
jgi:hypothetical protein